MTMHVTTLPTIPVKKITEYKMVMGITMYRGSLTGPRFSEAIVIVVVWVRLSGRDLVDKRSEKSVTASSPKE
jgi:hypothetical protein